MLIPQTVLNSLCERNENEKNGKSDAEIKRKLIIYQKMKTGKDGNKELIAKRDVNHKCAIDHTLYHNEDEKCEKN